ncbi:uncharacterized protein ColSpa_11872 [Colletotrichum spaethianum]|uniref:Uncharacterized protein n=1 Tax=Colletotrichum spaethianum TaxID=700344 RepID=A0AA37ULG2_9PEZI|nr:uncharacterized protein ColSpa_11872 [Colletotrichum spaethianum]GKT51691.1 hypothetical protein ColSpa_11872 [Colletotrichum spaethianum]
MDSDATKVNLCNYIRIRLDEAKSSLPSNQKYGCTVEAITVILYLLDVVVAVADWCMTDDAREAAGKEDMSRLLAKNRLSDTSDVARLTKNQALLRESRDQIKNFSRDLRAKVEAKITEINEVG